MADIGALILKYIELRDRKAELAKKQEAEMAPLNEAQATISNYLMHSMNELGVDQLKSDGVGTAFKANATSCQMQDPDAFKDFVFAPAVRGILNYLTSVGIDADQLASGIQTVIKTMPMWDLIDFRAGKKGITEYMANDGVVPGVAVNTISTVSIRRA